MQVDGRWAVCWKNRAWLITAETFAGWNGLAMRNAGSGRSPVREPLGIGGNEDHGRLEGLEQIIHRIEPRRTIRQLDVGKDQSGTFVAGELHGLVTCAGNAGDAVSQALHEGFEIHGDERLVPR